MSVLGTLAGFAQRRVAPLLTPYHHRRHRHTLKRGRVSRAALQRAAASWWGGDPRWYPGATSPRRHNRVTPLVDGERYFHELYEALASARHYVYIAGWCLTPDLPLRRAERQELVETRLVTLLRQVARRVPVRILLWGGAVAVIHPTRREMAAVARTFADQADGDLVCRLDHTARFSHCHHQKAIVIDGRAAFVGGMDLTTFQGDRWDRSGHPLRSGPNWHDLQFRLEGEIVADVEQNFLQRWRDSCRNCYPEAVPEPLPQRPPCFDPAWQTPAQIVRTIPHDTYASVRRGEFGIYHSYLEAFRRARRFIYIENQYLWSPQVMDALIEQVQRRRSEPFRIVIVLPAGAHSGKWDNDRHVKQLRAADGGRGIVSIYSLYASGPSAGVHAFRYRPIYVHAKLAIVDDEWLSAGSANLNNRGLVTDSEINVVISERETARNLRLDLWAEHLAVPREQIAQSDPITLIDQLWRDRAAENAAIQRHEDRGDRPLVCAVHRYDTGRLPASWFLDEAEALTFEH